MRFFTENKHLIIVSSYIMNIFFLSICVRRCARYHFDKHVVKMILELCQLLSSAWHMLNTEEAKDLLASGKILRKTHYNHPCAIWTRDHISNYNYVVKLALALCDEWRFRYGHPITKLHACETKLLFLLENPPPSILSIPNKISKNNPLGFTLPMPQAMFEECKWRPTKLSAATCMTAYRRYYMSKHKSHIVSWTKVNDSGDKKSSKRINLPKPYWWKNDK